MVPTLLWMGKGGQMNDDQKLKWLKYNPSYLLNKGYKSYRRIKDKFVETKYDAFYTNQESDKFDFYFKKRGIKVTYGLFLKDHPPMLHHITINNVIIFQA